MQLNPYLNFGGDCAEAFAFYEQCLGARITAMMRFEDGPVADQVSPELQDKVMHASLEIDGHVLMGTDGAPPDQPYRGVTGAHVVIGVDDPGQAERIFAALSENGTVEMAMEETFWARRFGMVVDRFGVPWMVNCDKPQPTRE